MRHVADGEESSEEWIGAPAAAKLLGVQLATVYRLIDREGLPAYRIGRVLRIRRSGLDAWLEARRVQPGELGHLYSASPDDIEEG